MSGTSEIEQIIVAREQRRCAAMCDADLSALKDVIDAELYFSHANGAVDDKAAYIHKMEQGRIVYRSINWSEQAVVVLPGDRAAILTGRMITEVLVNSVEKRLDNRVISIWAEACGQWRLRAFQSTPLPAV